MSIIILLTILTKFFDVKSNFKKKATGSIADIINNPLKSNF